MIFQFPLWKPSAKWLLVIFCHTQTRATRGRRGGGNGVKIGLLCKWVAGNLIGRFTDKSKRKKEEGQKKTGESQDSLKNAQWSRGKKKNIHLNNSPLSREIFISNKKIYISLSLFERERKKRIWLLCKWAVRATGVGLAGGDDWAAEAVRKRSGNGSGSVQESVNMIAACGG